jgi:hypothetical protein
MGLRSLPSIIDPLKAMLQAKQLVVGVRTNGQIRSWYNVPHERNERHPEQYASSADICPKYMVVS